MERRDRIRRLAVLFSPRIEYLIWGQDHLKRGSKWKAYLKFNASWYRYFWSNLNAVLNKLCKYLIFIFCIFSNIKKIPITSHPRLTFKYVSYRCWGWVEIIWWRSICYGDFKLLFFKNSKPSWKNFLITAGIFFT